MLLVHPSRNITLRGKRRSLAVNVGKYIMHWVFGIVQHTYIQETTAASGEAWDAWNNGTDFTFLFHDQVPGLLKRFRLIFPKLDDRNTFLSYMFHVDVRNRQVDILSYQATFPLKIAGRFHPPKKKSPLFWKNGFHARKDLWMIQFSCSIHRGYESQHWSGCQPNQLIC